MTAPKPIEPISDTEMRCIEVATIIRGDYRRRGVNLSPRHILSMIERIKHAEGKAIKKRSNG